jgi:uncharacterized membrane protein YGL010W
MLMKKSLREYLDQYAREHTHPGTKATHMIGIPMIVASLPLLPVNPPLGAALFAGGWALQLAGHYLFEKNNPSFVGDPFYLLVGPLWVAIEFAELLGIHVPLPGAPQQEVFGGERARAQA